MGVGTACGVCGGTIGESTACEVCIGYRAASNRSTPTARWVQLSNKTPVVVAEAEAEVEAIPASPFVKHDEGKPRPELLPPRALEEIAVVLAYGARKYTADNWRKNKDASRYVGAALRHVIAYMRGERSDPETERHHLAHACCCLMFIVDLELTETTGD